jgi:hypothetical protein
LPAESIVRAARALLSTIRRQSHDGQGAMLSQRLQVFVHELDRCRSFTMSHHD